MQHDDIDIHRDYKKEYREYHSKPEQKKNRAARNTARRQKGLKVGDPREVDHVKPLSKGGSNDPKNLKVVSRTANRKKGAKVAPKPSKPIKVKPKK